jgi:drug/metabolite transporter, DME family
VRRPYLTLVAVFVTWGTIPLVVRTVTLPAPAIVAVRLWVASIVLGLTLRLLPKAAEGPRLLSIRPGRSVTVGAILAVHWVALFEAYKRAPAGTVILIVYLAPVGVAAVAPKALGETVGGRTLVALALGLTGFVLVAANGVESAGGAGLALALLAAVTFVALVIMSKPLAESYGGLRLAFIEMTGAGILLIPVALGQAWGSPQAAWLWLVVLGAAHTALCIAFYFSALARVPATHVGILGYIEPASVVVCSWLVLGQTPSVATMIGGVLIAVAGAVIVRPTQTVEVAAGVPR